MEFFGSFPPLISLFSHSPSWNDFGRFQFPYSTCIEITSIIFTLFYLLHLPSFSHYYPPLNITCITSLSFIVLVSLHYLEGFCLGILPVNILYFSQSNPLYYSSLSFTPTSYCSTVFSVFHCALFILSCDIFQYYSLPISLFSFSSSNSLSLL
jgi:hypothetical protein